MPDPASIMLALDNAAVELDQRSAELAKVERERDALQRWHDDRLEATAVALWNQYTAGEVNRLPGEDVRVALARERMREDGHADRLDRLGELNASRRRLQAHIENLRATVSARQSVLSALKVEMEAVR